MAEQAVPAPLHERVVPGGSTGDNPVEAGDASDQAIAVSSDDDDSVDFVGGHSSVPDFDNLGRVLDMLNLKIVLKEPGDEGYILDEFLPPVERRYAAEFIAMDDRMQEMSRHLTVAKQEAVQCKQYAEQCQNKVLEAEQMNKLQQVKVETLEKKVHDLQELRVEYKEQIAIQEKELIDLRTDVKAYQKKQDELLESERVLQNLVERQVGQISNLKKEKTGFDKQLKEKEDQCVQYRKELEEARKKSQEEAGNNNKLKIEVENAQKIVEDKKADLHNAQQTIGNLQIDLKQAREAAGCLEGDLKKAQKKIDKQKEELDTAEGLIRELEAVRVEHTNLRVEHNQMDTNYKKIVSINKKLDEQVANLEGGVRERQEEINRLQTRLSRQEQETNAAKVKYTTVRETVFKMKEELDKYTEEWRKYVGFGGNDDRVANGLTPVEMLQQFYNLANERFRVIDNSRRELLQEVNNNREAIEKLEQFMKNMPQRLPPPPPPPNQDANVAVVYSEDGQHLMFEEGKIEVNSVDFSEETEPVLETKITVHRMYRSGSGFYCRCNPNVAYGSLKELKKHVKFFFANYKFKCFVCSKRYSAMVYLKDHLKKVHNVVLRPVKLGCTLCSSLFSTWKKLWYHKKLIHDVRDLKRRILGLKEQNRLRRRRVKRKKLLKRKTPLKMKLRRNSETDASSEYYVVSGRNSGTNTTSNPEVNQNRDVKVFPTISTRCVPGPSIRVPVTRQSPPSVRVTRSSLKAALPKTTPPPDLTPCWNHTCDTYTDIPELSAVSVREGEPMWSPPPTSPFQNFSRDDDDDDDSLFEKVDNEEQESVLHDYDHSKRREGHFCVCGRKFVIKTTLTAHIREHTQPWRFSCEYCGIKSFALSTLKRHYESAHKRVPRHIVKFRVGCTDCGRMFLSQVEQKQHKKSGQCDNQDQDPAEAGQKRREQSRSPGINDSMLEALNLKRKSARLSDKKSQAPSTSASSSKPGTSSASQPQMHGKDMKRLKGLYCLCGSKFATKQTLTSHIRTYTGEKHFECNVCFKRFRLYGALCKHYRGVHKVRKLPFRGFGCSDCGRMWKTLEEVRLHKKEVHRQNAGKPIKLEEQSSRRKRRRVAEEEEEVEQAPQVEPEERPLPPEELWQAPGEMEHKSEDTENGWMPNGSLPVQVKLEVDAENNLELPLHRINHRRRKEGFFCWCGHSSKSMSALKSHVLMHQVKKQFKCPYCTQCFKATFILRQHVKNVHRKVFKQQGCRRCGKLFETLKEVRLHQKAEHPESRGRMKPIDLTMATPAHIPEAPPIPPCIQEVSHVVPTTASKKHKRDMSKRHLGFHCTCRSKFRSEMDLETHIVHCNKNDKAKMMYRCDMCTEEPKRFLHLSRLVAHLKSAHLLEGVEDAVGMGCSTCGDWGFASHKELAIHRREDCLKRQQEAESNQTVNYEDFMPPMRSHSPLSSALMNIQAASTSGTFSSVSPPIPGPSRQRTTVKPIAGSPPSSNAQLPPGITLSSSVTLTPVQSVPTTALANWNSHYNNTRPSVSIIPLPSQPSLVISTGAVQSAEPISKEINAHGIDMSNKDVPLCRCGKKFNTEDQLHSHIMDSLGVHKSPPGKRSSNSNVRILQVPSAVLTSLSRAPATPSSSLSVAASVPSSTPTTPPRHKQVFPPNSKSYRVYCACSKDFPTLLTLQAHMNEEEETETQEMAILESTMNIARTPGPIIIPRDRRLPVVTLTPQPSTSRAGPSIVIPSKGTPSATKPRIRIRARTDSPGFPSLPRLSIEDHYGPSSLATEPQAFSVPGPSGSQVATPDAEVIVDAHLTIEPFTSTIIHSVSAAGVEAPATHVFVCKTCRMRFASINVLKMHMLGAHKISYNISNGCKTCGMTFQTNMELRKHYKDAHNAGLLFEPRGDVKYCPSPRPSTSNGVVGNETAENEDHVQVLASSNNPKRFHCKCGFHFATINRLDKHIRRASGKVKYFCDLCPAKFNSVDILRSHEETAHKDSYKFIHRRLKIEPNN